MKSNEKKSKVEIYRISPTLTVFVGGESAPHLRQGQVWFDEYAAQTFVQMYLADRRLKAPEVGIDGAKSMLFNGVLVRVGDRVRLTGNGEVHEFVVQESQHRPSLTDSGYRYYNDPDSWEVEIIQQPLPTRELMLVGDPTGERAAHYLFQDGVWRDKSGTDVPESVVRLMLLSHGFQVLYEGLPETEQ